MPTPFPTTKVWTSTVRCRTSSRNTCRTGRIQHSRHRPRPTQSDRVKTPCHDPDRRHWDSLHVCTASITASIDSSPEGSDRDTDDKIRCWTARRQGADCHRLQRQLMKTWRSACVHWTPKQRRKRVINTSHLFNIRSLLTMICRSLRTLMQCRECRLQRDERVAAIRNF